MFLNTNKACKTKLSLASSFYSSSRVYLSKLTQVKQKNNMPSQRLSLKIFIFTNAGHTLLLTDDMNQTILSNNLSSNT